MMTDWNGKRVIILGGARQGQAAARWLSRHDAHVTVNDRRTEQQMAGARSALAGSKVSWVLGSHPLELLDQADILCISGGIPLDNPLIVEAVKRSLPLTNDTQVFMEVLPCPAIGITGSAGKTTTTSLVGWMARKAEGLTYLPTAPTLRKVWVGGNIGDPLLNHVDEMSEEDLAILEISSFQLEQMSISPAVAAVLNITPNHLDRHGTMESYAAAKKRILDFQNPADTAVLCREDPGSWNLRESTHGRVVSFGFGPLEGQSEGTSLLDGKLYLRKQGVESLLMDREQIHLRGDHNVMNALAAFAIGYGANLPAEAMVAAAKEFHGVAHRLELVREWNGVQWYNDSIATAPERTMAAIRSFNEPIVLLLGGRDKNLPWDGLADLVRQRVKHVLLFGEAAGKIEAALSQAGGQLPETLKRCKTMEEALQQAAVVAQSGDVVLLSPGGTSFDQYRDFEERGEAFRKWVSELS
jgi:UDP-N-acetylmuramoylalanine--D-glutamate ligase